MSSSGGGGLVRVPNLRVCDHLGVEVAHAGGGGEKGESTSCRGTVLSAWQGEDRDASKGKWSPRGSGATVLA